MTHFVWDIDPEIFSFQIGSLTLAPRYYGLMFALGLLSGYHLIKWVYEREGRTEQQLNAGFLTFVLGIIIGARLGHVIFYDPIYYLNNPLEIPMVWKGGLASHGGVVGIFVAMLFYTRRERIPFVWMVDRLALPTLLASPFIRIGNFFNSEIVGRPSDLPWAIIFKQHDENLGLPLTPRHPAQLYEAFSYWFFLIVVLVIYKRWGDKLRPGMMGGAMFAWIFSARFLIEFVKEDQKAFEQGMLLNMGQILSIPMIVMGLIYFFGAWERIGLGFMVNGLGFADEPAGSSAAKSVKKPKKKRPKKGKR